MQSREELEAVIKRLYTDNSKVFAQKIALEAGVPFDKDETESILEAIRRTAGFKAQTETLKRIGKTDRARDIYEDQIEKSRGTNLGEYSAEYLLDIGELDRAKTIANELIDFHVKLDSHFRATSWALRIGDVDKAIEILDLPIKSEYSSNVMYHSVEAAVRTIAEHYNLDLNPIDNNLYVSAPWTYQFISDLPKARQFCENAIECLVEEGILTPAADLIFILGDKLRARSLYDQAMENKRDMDHWHIQVRYDMERGARVGIYSREELETHWRETIAEEKDHFPRECISIALKLGDHELAKELTEKRIRKLEDGDHFNDQYWAAMEILKENKDLERAAKNLKKYSNTKYAKSFKNQYDQLDFILDEPKRWFEALVKHKESEYHSYEIIPVLVAFNDDRVSRFREKEIERCEETKDYEQAKKYAADQNDDLREIIYKETARYIAPNFPW